MSEDNEQKENDDLLELVKTAKDIDIKEKSDKNDKGFEDNKGNWVKFNEKEKSRTFTEN